MIKNIEDLEIVCTVKVSILLINEYVKNKWKL